MIKKVTKQVKAFRAVRRAIENKRLDIHFDFADASDKEFQEELEDIERL